MEADTLNPSLTQCVFLLDDPIFLELRQFATRYNSDVKQFLT